MALANNMCSFSQGFRPSTSSPEVEYDQSEQCTTALAKFEDLSPEKKEILQLRSGCPHVNLICSAHEKVFMKFCELRQKTCDTLQNHLLQSQTKDL
jgi:hypothetical protein